MTRSSSYCRRSMLHTIPMAKPLTRPLRARTSFRDGLVAKVLIPERLEDGESTRPRHSILPPWRFETVLTQRLAVADLTFCARLPFEYPIQPPSLSEPILLDTWYMTVRRILDRKLMGAPNDSDLAPIDDWSQMYQHCPACGVGSPRRTSNNIMHV